MEERLTDGHAAALPSTAVDPAEISDVLAWWIAGTQDNPAWYLTD